ncbi:MAG: V-type ATP synthase subunit E family protein [Candidatus Izemoplasmatales bacterium]
MPYYNNDDLFRSFSKYINEKADQKINQLKEEIEKEKKRSVERVDKELHNKIFRGLDIELSELNSDFAAEMNKVKTEYSKDIMEKRSQLLSSIIDKVHDKLLGFNKSKQYENLMKKQIQNIGPDFCTEEVEFRIMKNDTIMKKIIEDNYKGPYTIKEISEIEIGGFSVLCFKLGVMTDQTIDTRLEQKRQWLYEHSKLAASQ